MFQKFASEFEAVKVGCGATDAAARAFWDLTWTTMETMSHLKQFYVGGKSYKTAQRVADNFAPPISITCLHEDRETQAVTKTCGSEYPKKQFADTLQWRLLLEKTVVQLKEVVEVHRDIHNFYEVACETGAIFLSVDGVPEGQCGGTLDIVSVAFPGCRIVYTLQILRPAHGYAYCFEEMLDALVDEIRENGIVVRLVLADAPMRAKLRMQKNHNGRYGCDYCCLPSVSYKEKGEPRSKRYWPESYAKPGADRSFLRSHQATKELVTTKKLDKIPAEESVGMVGKSPLLRLDNFDIVNDIPADGMHQIHKGIVAQVLELTFQISSRARETRGGKIAVGELNELLRSCAVPYEFSRRLRDIDIANPKAEEYRNLAVAIFPLVAQAIGDVDRPEYEIWMTLAFLCRCYTLPNVDVTTEFLGELHYRFARLFRKTFGRNQMSYNFHIFGHFPRLRNLGPITSYGTYPFEASYALVRRYVPRGTMSLGKQTLNRAYRKLVGSKHRCQPRIKVSTEAKATAKMDDSFVYVEEFKFLRVVHMDGAKTGLTCAEVATRPYQTAFNLPFNLTGVAHFAGYTGTETHISYNDVIGKAVVVNTFEDARIIIALPKAFLQEGKIQ